ncbi:MAG: O-acetyl-ADP-ribose deacetylase [bacterium]|nr:O-acetyl-ADP-ribose deacetylase [bacterium]
MSPSLSGRLAVFHGDITRLEADAIVNAANSSLLGGGGVDGAIHRRAGPGLLAECRALGGCPVGQARLTGGHGLPARHVIHTVGPRWRGGGHGEEDLLASCYRASLGLAAAEGIASVAFPCVSTGAYGYPPEEACVVAVNTVADWLREHDTPARVVFCCFSAGDAELYTAVLAAILPPPGADEAGDTEPRWLHAADSPFGVEVLDCSAFAAGMISTTAAPGIAERFLELRDDDGSRLRGADPQDARSLPADLAYRLPTPWRPGPLFRAPAMEVKWDVSLHEDTLYLTRSWTGSLEFRARLSLQADRARVTNIVAAGNWDDQGTGYAAAVVDFVVRSHVLHLRVPHPLPPGTDDDARRLAMASFSLYGRLGRYGRRGDTTTLAPLGT